MPSKYSYFDHLKKESSNAWFEQEVKKQILWLTLKFALVYPMSYFFSCVYFNVIADLQMIAMKKN